MLVALIAHPLPGQWHPVPPERMALALYVAVGVIIAPITEEILLRGWIYTGLRAKLGAIPCIAITSLLFSLFHWEPTHLYMILVLPGGIILAVVRERTGSTQATASLHGAYNLTALFLKVVASR